MWLSLILLYTLVQGRLAQLVERHIDVVNVRGSNPLSPTNYSPLKFYLTLIKSLLGSDGNCSFCLFSSL